MISKNHFQTRWEYFGGDASSEFEYGHHSSLNVNIITQFVILTFLHS